MKKFSLTNKILAILLVTTFTFQTMESINSHTYTTGVKTINLDLPPGVLTLF